MKITNINEKPVVIKRALISVFDKTGVVEIAKKLDSLNVEIISTGGTASTLKKANVNVINVSDFTGFPEVMDGRVKTINPLIEGGILGLRDRHQIEASNVKIKWIDLVICNLYPFQKIINEENVSISKVYENIDIGGPTMIRSAAKNIGWVSVLTNHKDYDDYILELSEKKCISFETRKKLSIKAFKTSANYESTIHNYLNDEKFPDSFTLNLKKHSDLRYGENPHQLAAAYKIDGKESINILSSEIIQGKKLSYNNLMDSNANLNCLFEFNQPSCVIIKHANPCGVAIGKNIKDSFLKAFNCDSLSAFGGIVGVNEICDEDLAKEMNKIFFEVILAPGYTNKAIKILAKKKNLRLIKFNKEYSSNNSLELRDLNGGVLIQEFDSLNISENNLQVVTKVKPEKKHIEDMLFGWKVLKHIKSNGILIVKNFKTIGIGAGQVSRIDSVDIAINKSKKDLNNSVLCSDAFFPFRDSIDKIAKTGIKTIIQPGGSIKDEEVIQACDEHKISMVFTGNRCFKH